MSKTTISKSVRNISTIEDNMVLKRIVDTTLTDVFRQGKLSSEAFYPVDLAKFKELSGYVGEATVRNAISDLVAESKQAENAISEAFSLFMVEETDRYKMVYRPITAIKVDKTTGGVSLRFSPELLKLVQGSIGREGKDKFGKEVELFKLNIGEFYQQDVRMLNTPSSVHAMYDILAKELWKGRFLLEYKEIRAVLGLDYEVNGKPVVKYKAYADFKRKILLPTLKAMQERLGVEVLLSESRGNRGVVRLGFTVLVKDDAKTNPTDH